MLLHEVTSSRLRVYMYQGLIVIVAFVTISQLIQALWSKKVKGSRISSSYLCKKQFFLYTVHKIIFNLFVDVAGRVLVE